MENFWEFGRLSRSAHSELLRFIDVSYKLWRADPEDLSFLPKLRKLVFDAFTLDAKLFESDIKRGFYHYSTIAKHLSKGTISNQSKVKVIADLQHDLKVVKMAGLNIIKMNKEMPGQGFPMFTLMSTERDDRNFTQFPLTVEGELQLLFDQTGMVCVPSQCSEAMCVELMRVRRLRNFLEEIGLFSGIQNRPKKLCKSGIMFYGHTHYTCRCFASAWILGIGVGSRSVIGRAHRRPNWEPYLSKMLAAYSGTRKLPIKK